VVVIDEVQYEHCETSKIPLAFYCKISSSFCPGSKEENDYMSYVQYNRRLIFAMGMFKYFTCSWCCQWTHGKSR
jgi:hypothetical protein